MIRFFTLLLGVLLPVLAGQGQTVFRIDSLPAQGILLNKGWTWHAGDNPDWAKPNFDDSKWESIDPTKDIYELPQVRQAELGWFRIRLRMSPAVLSRPLAMVLSQVGASEIYLNGRLIYRFGQVSADYDDEQTYYLYNRPFQLKPDQQPEQLIAVRYSFNRQNFLYKLVRINNCFSLNVSSSDEAKAFSDYVADRQIITGENWLLSGLFLILAMFCLTLYKYLRSDKAYLYLGLFAVCNLAFHSTTELSSYFTTNSARLYVRLAAFSMLLIAIIPIIKANLLLFNLRWNWFSRFVVGYALLAIPFLLWSYHWGGTLATLTLLLINTYSLIAALHGVRIRRPGAWIIVIQDILGYLFFGGAFLLKNKPTYSSTLIALSSFPIPVCFMVFIAGEYIRTAQSLTQRVVEIESLSDEKQLILSTQNETLELQVSERTAELSQKNGELVIEAALERVRTQSMAMQHSDDLQKVITVVSVQLQALGFEFDYVNFVVVRADRGWDSYNAVPDNDEIVNYTIPYVEHKLFSQGEEVIQQGLDFFTYTLTLEEKNDWLTYIFNQPIYRDVPYEYKQLLIDLPGMAGSVVVSLDLGFSIANYHGVPYTDTENAIFKRFGAVFGQAYTRFLDLKKAEEQAREARIEVALERVRSRSLAMHSSEELKEVITLVFAQLNQLDVAITDGAAIIALVSEDSRDTIHWTANPDRISEANRFQLPYFYHPMQNVYWDAREKGLDFVAHAFTFDEKNSFWDQAFLISDYRYLPEETKQWIYASSGYACSFAIGEHSAMMIDSFSGKMYSDQENDILKRFARVFEQSYVRFLDLQKAETQAREAQIEAALERVRSQSMAMQHSDHLQDVIKVISAQLLELGFQYDYVNIIVERADQGWDCYNAILNYHDISLSFVTIPYVDSRLFNDVREIRRQGLDFFTYTLTQDEKNEWLTYLFTQTTMIEAPEEYKQFVLNAPGMATSAVVWPDLGFSIVNYQGTPYTEPHNAIFKRFGAVFVQAYTRFKDLKKAEDQAREAIRTASLDRVRAEIASMRTTQDLERITPLIWAELTTLQVPFFRCGVFIVHEAQQCIQAFLSTPDGHSRTQLNLPIDQTANTQQIVENWQHQRTYTDRWSHEQLQQWATSMVEDGQIDSLQEYEVIDKVKEAFSLQFVPFKQGMLYVGSMEPLTGSQMNLTQSLADAFSVAYARYEDFRQLEEAKARVDTTLTELKATQAQLVQKEKMASLGELTAGIAHEIQNPLNFVNNFSEVSTELVTELEEEQQKPDRDTELEADILSDLKQNLQKITHHGGRASAIVKGMLEHSRASTGERQPTDLNALADEYLRLAYQGLRAKDKNGSTAAADRGRFNCDLVTDFAPDVDPVSVVPADIGRVLLNLFNNAFYAVGQRQQDSDSDGTSYKPTVRVSTRQDSGKIEIRVRDNGTGISDAVKAKIFQPFFTTKPTGEGTGLGLSLSYDIITKGHKGTMEVESREGEGSEFVVRLPM